MILFVFLFSAGWINLSLKTPSKLNSNYELYATGTVNNIDNQSEKWIKILFKPELIYNDSVPVKKGDLWLLLIKNDKNYPQIIPGVKIAVKGKLLKHPDNSNPGAFNYGAFLHRSGISGQIFIKDNDLEIIDFQVGWSFNLLSGKIREYCVNVFSKFGIGNSNLSLLNALVLGDRKGIERDLNEKFIRSGAIHLLAVSGLHVGIVYLFLNYLMAFFFRSSNIIRLIIIIAILFIYAFITGFSPSVTRAVLMFSLIQTGKFFSRNINMYNILCLSAFIILLWNPMFLFHAGFWLSHLAVAGIVAFYPFINGLLTFKFIVLRWLWSLISVSMAAQITTIPFSLALFGSFPSYFLLTNIFLLPLVAPILLLAFLLLIISEIPVLPVVIGRLLCDLVEFMEKMVGFIEGLPNSYISNIWVSWSLAIILYLTIVYFYQNINYRRPYIFIRMGLFLMLGIFIVNFQTTFKRYSNKLIVFDAGNELLVKIINRGHSTVFTSTGLKPSQRSFISGNFEKKYVLKQKDLYNINFIKGNQLPELYRIQSGLKTYLLLNGGKGSFNARGIYKADVVIISGSPDLDLERMLKEVQCNRVVFASNVPLWLSEKWEKQLNRNNVITHNVKIKGAYLNKD